MLNYYFFLLLGISIFGINQVTAQTGITTITGKIVEDSNGGPIEFATVLVGNSADQNPLWEQLR